jgi:inorganic pyrophosphatase
MLPYAFSAFTIKSVGNASVNLFNEVKTQFTSKPEIKQGRERCNYVRAITQTAHIAFTELGFPAFVCLGLPFLIGVLFGPLAIAGLLPGILISGLSMAISNTNTSGAWN